MLKPSMSELMNKVGNRYLLVNLAAQRARDLSDEASKTGEPLLDKAVQTALEDIVEDRIVYRPGPKEEKPALTVPPILAGSLDVIDLDFADEEDMEHAEDEETEEFEDGNE